MNRRLNDSQNAQVAFPDLLDCTMTGIRYLRTEAWTMFARDTKTQCMWDYKTEISLPERRDFRSLNHIQTEGGFLSGELGPDRWKKNVLVEDQEGCPGP